MKKKKPSEPYQCAVDPQFDGLMWDFITGAAGKTDSVAELVLWRRVILHALSDLCSIATNPSSRYNQAAAERWFLESQAHFFVVCQLADVDAPKLRAMVRRACDHPDTAFDALRQRMSRN